MQAVGNNGSIRIEGDKVVISRKGAGLVAAMTIGFQGDKYFAMSQITGIEVSPPRFMTVGYIRLSTTGRDPVGGVNEAVRDENAVLFNKKALPDFEAIRDALVPKIGRPTTSAPSSVADQIEKLANLRDRGLLSDAEFAQQKRKLLAS